MAKSAVSLTPTREDFESLLAESYSDNPATEGSVVKGRVVNIENDFAIIDVGLKTEGKIAVKEFAQPGKASELKIGDTVEVYLERIENAMGEAVLSRDKAKREEAWTRLEQMSNKNERVDGVIFGRVKGGFTVDLGGAVAFLPGRTTLDMVSTAVVAMPMPRPLVAEVVVASRGHMPSRATRDWLLLQSPSRTMSR